MALDNISPDLRFYRDREASPFVLRVYAAHTPRERSPMRLQRIRLAISLHFARLCCAYAARTLAYAPAANTARKYIQIAGIQSFINLTCYTEIMKLLQCVGMIYVVR